jgi:hypothetical protein
MMREDANVVADCHFVTSANFQIAAAAGGTCEGELAIFALLFGQELHSKQF